MRPSPTSCSLTTTSSTSSSRHSSARSSATRPGPVASPTTNRTDRRQDRDPATHSHQPTLLHGSPRPDAATVNGVPRRGDPCVLVNRAAPQTAGPPVDAQELPLLSSSLPRRARTACKSWVVGSSCSDTSMHKVAVGALIREGRVLLAHRRPEKRVYPNVWELPG